MKFVDECNIIVSSGNGGNGCISFRREKYINKGGPNGGNGGDGGNVWLTGNKHLKTLIYFTFKKKYYAQCGQNGKKNNKTGKKGKDIFIQVPLGTRITDINKNTIICDITYDKQTLLIAKGGKHGAGNTRFKSSVNRYPKIKTMGKKGNIYNINLKLIFLADVGILGLPNAGKSTFLRAISSSKTKISNYPFTTLIPNLGVVFLKKKKFIVADIPGIIKGSSYGLGLGINFLKHLEKCKILLHIIDICPLDKSNPIENANIIVNEIKKYSIVIYKKPTWLVFNKIDLLKTKKILIIANAIAKSLNLNKKYYLISAINKQNTKKLCLDLYKYIINSK
ncbi:MAG: Obg family GTPase CgtA [Candidatus Makana argininalis]